MQQQAGNVNQLPPNTMVGAMNQIGNINMPMNINNANQTVAQNQMNASNINQQLNAGQQINPQMSQILNRMNQQNAPNMANQINQNQQMVNQLNAGGSTTSEFLVKNKPLKSSDENIYFFLFFSITTSDKCSDDSKREYANKYKSTKCHRTQSNTSSCANEYTESDDQ